jgi:hypothetical protein
MTADCTPPLLAGLNRRSGPAAPHPARQPGFADVGRALIAAADRSLRTSRFAPRKIGASGACAHDVAVAWW